MERRGFLMAGAALAAAAAGGLAAPAMASPAVRRRADAERRWPTELKGPFIDLTTGPGNREAWARLLGNTDMRSTKYGWAVGRIQGVRPGEAVRDLVGFTMMSAARLLPFTGDAPGYEGVTGYRKVLREVGLYFDLASGEIIDEWRNPYLNETVKIFPIANDPFNHLITEFRPNPPTYGGLNTVQPPKRPLQFDWRRSGDMLQMYSGIHLFYPSALQPEKWPRENAHPFNQVSEMFNYEISWADMQDRRKTSVEYTGTWVRTTPWLPWMLMGPTPGHCQYVTHMGSFNDIERIERRCLDYVEKHFPKYLTAPDRWEEPSLSSLEHYARERTPAPVAPGQPVPRAPDPELPAWWRARQQGAQTRS